MSQKRVLVVQNFAGTGLGALARALEERGVAVDLRRLDQGEALPESAEGFNGLIVLGGAQNALDDVGSPYFPALLLLIRMFEERDCSVLGICLGAQLMARAFGGENRIGTASEFGWQEVVRCEESAGDPVFGSLPDRFPVFQWHDDTFTVPEGAIHLAASRAAPMQAFRIGRAAYGVQFHFEADSALVQHWSETFAAYLAERQPGWEARRDLEEARNAPKADAVGAAIAQAWSAML